MPHDVVTMNSQVKFRNLTTGEELTRTLVYPAQMTDSSAQLSVLAPVGAALLGLRFNERCSFGLEDFVFNAAAYRRISKAVYIPQVVYRHFEGTQSTSCARSAQALPRPGSHIFDAPAAGCPRPRRHSPPRLADAAAGAGPVSRRDG